MSPRDIAEEPITRVLYWSSGIFPVQRVMSAEHGEGRNQRFSKRLRGRYVDFRHDTLNIRRTGLCTCFA